MLRKKQSILAKIFTAFFIISIYLSVFSYAFASVLDEAKSIIENNYAFYVTDTQLNGAATVDDMVKSLNDPYSVYMTADEYKDFVDSINQDYVGIGIQYDIVVNGARVLNVYDGSSAAQAGLQAGDVITAVDGRSLAGLSLDDVANIVKGDEGSSVTITYQRDNVNTTVSMVRKQLVIPTIDAMILDNHIGYIDITSFADTTVDEFRSILTQMKDKNVDRYIIDLRDDPGGYVDTALNMEGFFIGKNVGMITSGKSDPESLIYSVAQDMTVDKPTIFLTNENSASASEILSAAVKYYDKAYFIGNTTYGKGLMQEIFPLSDGSCIKLSVERFYTPAGNYINKAGVKPDLFVKDSDTADSAQVAYLMSAVSGNEKDKTGYLRVYTKGEYFEISLNNAEKTTNWQAFEYMLNTLKSNGAILQYGTAAGYQTVSPSAPIESMLFPSFKNAGTVKNAPADYKYTVSFTSAVDLKSISSSSFSIINASTGETVPVVFTKVSDTKYTMAPQTSLKSGTEYYFVVNGNIKTVKDSYIKGSYTIVDVK